MKKMKRVVAMLISLLVIMQTTITVKAEPEITSPSVVLIEASTGKIIYEKNFTERRSPASITKIMTLLIAFDNLSAGKIKMDDVVTVSEHASSMGGSQVFLAEGETQSLETMIKCIVVASGNDASVAVAEHIAGTEEAFVELMNKKAEELGMDGTHFIDCCGLSDSDDHYTTAKDVAAMSRELITKHPEIYEYTKIWSEDITHETRNGSSIFTLNSTNKLLKQYTYTTGLKTGSTSKAMYCMSATASKDGIDLIAVIMGAPDNKTRFGEAKVLLNYGFNVCNLYVDSKPDIPDSIKVRGGIEETAGLKTGEEFRYLDIDGNDLSTIEKKIELPAQTDAPVNEGDTVGKLTYILNGDVIGSVPIVFSSTVEQAFYLDYLKKAAGYFLL